MSTKKNATTRTKTDAAKSTKPKKAGAAETTTSAPRTLGKLSALDAAARALPHSTSRAAKVDYFLAALNTVGCQTAGHTVS
jgi:hypothetical protein